MLSALATAEVVTWLSIVVKAVVYGATLVASGCVLVLLTLKGLPEPEIRSLRRLAGWSAVIAAVVSLLRLPLRASFLMGGTLEGAFEPMMLGMVSESPLGTAIALRILGLVLIFGIVLRGQYASWLATFGAFLAASSFAFRGHALEEPRILLGVLVTLHMVGLAYWFGGLAPLYRAAADPDPAVAGRLALEFGRKALWIVAFLSTAGLATLAILTGGTPAAALTAYGQFFVVKLAVFLAVLALAAWNKVRLTPALIRAEPGAGGRLRRSIRFEALLIAAVLLITATLTTITAPA